MKEILNFCTLFDSSYIHYGLALHRSLQKNCKNFHLYIFAFDEECKNFLKKLSLLNVTIISLEEFEDKELLAIKPSRSKGEYCWTCSSSTILYVLEKYKVTNCTYIDADLYFFSDPKILIDEIKDKSILLIEHRYSKQHDQSAISGKYCVQFMYFRNNEYGLNAVKWWRERCIEWCFSKPEDGKFGDQKYLDDWMLRFHSVHELQNLGGGVAPWNFDHYHFKQQNGRIIGEEKDGGKSFELVFFHFHGLKLLNKFALQLTCAEYEIEEDVLENIYKPYVIEIEKMVEIASSIKALQDINNRDLSFFKRLKLAIFPMKKNIISRKKWLT